MPWSMAARAWCRGRGPESRRPRGRPAGERPGTTPGGLTTPPPVARLCPHARGERFTFFTNLFRQVDVVMGMRFHNCVLGFGAGTRFISLGSHPKLRFFAEDTELTQYAIPLLDPERETASGFFDTIRCCLKDEEYKKAIQFALRRELAKLRSFNERVLDLVS